MLPKVVFALWKKKVKRVSEILHLKKKIQKKFFCLSSPFQHVPETIEFMMNAGIRVWMLTGDKFETAFSVACLSGLCSARNDLLHLILKNKVVLFQSIKELQMKAKKLQRKGMKFSLAISGSVSYFLFFFEWKRRFIEL